MLLIHKGKTLKTLGTMPGKNGPRVVARDPSIKTKSIIVRDVVFLTPAEAKAGATAYRDMLEGRARPVLDALLARVMA